MPACLTQSREVAEYFEDLIAARLAEAAKARRELDQQASLFGALKRAGLEIAQSPVEQPQLAGLLRQIQRQGHFRQDRQRSVRCDVERAKATADAIIAAKGLKQISDSGELEAIIDGVLAANPKSVEEYRAGKEKAFNALVGQAMKATKGKGNPAQINEILKKKLAG